MPERKSQKREKPVSTRKSGEATAKRVSRQKRKTRETSIDLELNIDGSGQCRIETGLKMLDHLVSQIARHGVFDITIFARGDNAHHLVEDVAITLGRSFNGALGDKRGLVRIASATVPMDDTLASVTLDFGGRGYCVLDMAFAENDMAGFPTDLVRHFLEAFAIEGRLNLHARVIYGVNDHHKAEALFKALGRALDAATRIDPRLASELPSTKGYIES